MIWDCFPFGSAEAETDILECRLRELEGIPDLHHVIVEAEVTHRGDKKPMWFREHAERFKPWGARITYVHVPAKSLPSFEEDPNPWSREYAQREFCGAGLDEADPNDIILHGDADEIPRPGAITALSKKELPFPAVFQMRLCMYAADWLHPLPWQGTIRTRYRSVGSFAKLRDMRNSLPVIIDGGSHLSWMGGTPAHQAKLDTHCHLEMSKETEAALRSGEWLREGRHSDGHKLEPVDVDETWPRWVYERQCPKSWFRPRGEASA
jgi:Glycosyltransferase family 17